ncbi:acyl transferase [Lutimonas zeaxanthinifaciens]|uniref:LuxE/PaaK family acyltransferase n=1 Tax=Lutimonas zeaxanthinifaciens TaxID=3060215 RepID=UPI00265CB2EF|nr:acyl transferase [Lutimonas sp. YSD2104]WKK67624.1 acyl transferase [Lutimonas sp. YSD2104]
MDIFDIRNDQDFEKKALDIFRYQARYNQVYKKFIELLKIDPFSLSKIDKIPFLPVEFFKFYDLLSSKEEVKEIFTSSGTTGVVQSRHLVTDLNLYEQSFLKGFNLFYGQPEKYTILALLPGYLERKGSSLIYMVNQLILSSQSSYSGFYLDQMDELSELLIKLNTNGEKVILIGVTYALLDLIEHRQFKLKNTIVMETGGMKGKRKEIVRNELHKTLCKGFGVNKIHSEYGMTELLSQAYSKGDGLFKTPPWMKILIRDTEDPMTLLQQGRTGGVNIIDLANVNSISFIATQDLGREIGPGQFEILGRFDHSDIRGCNLMVV